jgi:hypothetical protein
MYLVTRINIEDIYIYIYIYKIASTIGLKLLHLTRKLNFSLESLISIGNTFLTHQFIYFSINFIKRKYHFSFS